jgi:hypothetical protein
MTIRRPRWNPIPRKNRIFRSIGTGLLLWPVVLAAQSVPKAGLESITPQDMKSHVVFLASDGMKGRETPSRELDSCAAYIADQFKRNGLKPVTPEGSYFQVFNTVRKRLGEPNRLWVKSGGVEKEYLIKDDFVPLSKTANRKILDVGVVFAGYGITAPEFGYDDYAGLDVQGKAVFMFAGEPRERDSTTTAFDGTKETDHSKLRLKVENALDHGAVGLVLVSSPRNRFRRPPNSWPSLMKNVPEDAVPLGFEEKQESQIVSVQIGRTLADALLEGTGQTLESVYHCIDSTLAPKSFGLPGLAISIETDLEGTRTPIRNVIGLWEGSDPVLKNEYVVIGAHYDHVGIQGDQIYNGADDDASGTSGVMELAQAFASSPVRPKRSILFMAFPGEEKGLFGSMYYTENPLFPLDKTVAMVSLDMISRNDSNQVIIVGSKVSKDLTAINEACSKAIGLNLEYNDKYFLQSDHYSFYKKGIPVLFYFTGDSPVLHTPDDDVETINPDKMARVGRLIFSTIWTVANRTEKPDFNKVR